MIEKLKIQLRNLEEHEALFGDEILDGMHYETQGDSILAGFQDYPSVRLTGEDGFEQAFFTLIGYMTEMRSRFWNDRAGVPEKYRTRYYHDWLNFHKAYNIRKAWFYLNVRDMKDVDEVTDLLMKIQGQNNYYAVVATMNTPSDNWRGLADIVINYVGHSRAIRDLSMRYLDPVLGVQWQFHLWHMTPNLIIEEYDYVFYIGNGLGDCGVCAYAEEAADPYYIGLYNKLISNMDRDIPANETLSVDQKRKIRAEIEAEVMGRDEK